MRRFGDSWNEVLHNCGGVSDTALSQLETFEVLP